MKRTFIILCTIICTVLLSSCDKKPGSDNLKNTSELSLPLTDNKMVIAHCMTNIIRYQGHKFEDSCDPEYYAATGNITAPLGGLTQVKPLADSVLKNATLDEAVEYEMAEAKKSGIDGFQFYYTLGNKSWDDIIKAYFRVAGKKNIDFKFTFCVSHPNGSTEAKKIEEFASRMNNIFDEVGHDNPHWLRAPDGRLLLYMWYGDSLADIPADRKGLPAQYYIANAYKKLSEAVKEKFACIFSINENISTQELNNYLDYFPATWIWTVSYTPHYIGNMVAAECKRRNRTFTGSTFGDFYTSKLLKRGTWDMYHYAADAVAAGIGNVERKYIATGLSYNFRRLLEFGIQHDVPIMNVITWNDYPEGHHLAPEINHNDGFAVLLNYYKSVWKNQASPYINKDVAVVFFKKYNHSVEPNPYNIPLVCFQENAVSLESEDSIEVVTLLNEKSSLIVNNENVTVNAGLQCTRFAQKTGTVQVAVKRGGNTVLQYTTPQDITDKPFRTDRITYTMSNLWKP